MYTFLWDSRFIFIFLDGFPNHHLIIIMIIATKTQLQKSNTHPVDTFYTYPYYHHHFCNFCCTLYPLPAQCTAIIIIPSTSITIFTFSSYNLFSLSLPSSSSNLQKLQNKVKKYPKTHFPLYIFSTILKEKSSEQDIYIFFA